MHQMAAEGQSNKTTSHVEVHMKQICVIQFSHAGKKKKKKKKKNHPLTFIDVCVDENQTADASTVSL